MARVAWRTLLLMIPFAKSSGLKAHQESHRVQRETETANADAVAYRLFKPFEIQNKLERWKNQYPDLIKVTTAQSKYGLPAAGGENDCKFWEDGNGCPNYIFTIQDYVVHPEDSESSKLLPEVFLSGCLHGNERVGPTAVMEAVKLLLEAAYCEGLPRSRDEEHVGHSIADYGSWESQVEEAKTCRSDLKKKGVDDSHRKWLARLVTTRRIVGVPTANALGYFRVQREEGRIDPNRDFPYDVEDPKLCMQTIAGRTLNEIYREHMFQLALTFHAGMEAVAYEWGAPTWLGHLSPDDEAQSQVGSAYSRYGAGWESTKPYQYGTMNDVVYFVRGGMEDWAYAGSFDPDRVIGCEPETHGGYPKEKTIYNDSTLRVFNMLVETSNNKSPKGSDLGTSENVLSRDTEGNGHVSRNIRLSLLAAEMVEPYVSIVGVNDILLSDDIVPLSGRGGRSCQKSKAVMVANNAEEVEFQWSVGGSMTIDETQIWYAKWDDIGEAQLDCLSQPSNITGFKNGTIIGDNSGTGLFSKDGASPRPNSASRIASSTDGPIFKGKISIPEGMKTLEKLVVIVSARVDGSWAKQPKDIAPKLPPQSHVVNARTNPDWHHESSGKKIQGRLDWFSMPVTVVIGDFKDNAGTQGEHLVNTVEMNPRFGDNENSKGGMKPNSAANGKTGFPIPWWLLLVVPFLCSCCMMLCGKTKARPSLEIKHSNRYLYSDDDDELSDTYADNPKYTDEEFDDEIELSEIS